MSEDMQKYRFLQSVIPDPVQQQLVLLTGARQLEKQRLGGLVIYRGDEVKKLDDFDIWAVPSYRLFC
jgi:hypothetical protein